MTSKFKEYVVLVHKIVGKKTKKIRSTNGSEYVSNETEEYIRIHGIQHHLTVSYCPSQNGVAGRKKK